MSTPTPAQAAGRAQAGETRRANTINRDKRAVLAVRTYLDQQRLGGATHVGIQAITMILDRV